MYFLSGREKCWLLTGALNTFIQILFLFPKNLNGIAISTQIHGNSSPLSSTAFVSIYQQWNHCRSWKSFVHWVLNFLYASLFLCFLINMLQEIRKWANSFFFSCFSACFEWENNKSRRENICQQWKGSQFFICPRILWRDWRNSCNSHEWGGE